MWPSNPSFSFFTPFFFTLRWLRVQQGKSVQHFEILRNIEADPFRAGRAQTLVTSNIVVFSCLPRCLGRVSWTQIYQTIAPNYKAPGKKNPFLCRSGKRRIVYFCLHAFYLQLSIFCLKSFSCLCIGLVVSRELMYIIIFPGAFCPYRNTEWGVAGDRILLSKDED